MEDVKEKSEELPERFKNHCMAGKYEYETVCKETGIANPVHVGNFVVTRPHNTFRVLAHLNQAVDPFPKLEEVTMDVGDVLLVTPAKTGTHLLMDIMKMLQTETVKHTKPTAKDRWLDSAPYDEILVNQPAPRVLMTHQSMNRLPPNFREKNTQVVISLRNFKDTFVSLYHHLRSLKNGAGNQSWPAYFTFCMYSKSVAFGNYFDQYADIWDHCRDDPNVLIVFYESLVRNKKESVERIAQHLGVKYTDQLLNDIVTATEFKTMKKVKDDQDVYMKQLHGENFTFYRKGEVGDWKNWFTVAQNEEFHRKFDEWNKETQIPMVFE